MSQESQDKELREELESIPGEVSTSKCGCTWKRVKNFSFRGVVMRGDLLVRYCEWHAWYAKSPLHQKREISRQLRQARS